MMPLRVRRAISGGLLACALVLAGPMTANAALLWTLLATPLTATTGVSRTFTLTATTLDVLTPIRCIVLDVPGNFAVESTSATTSGWTAALAGNRVTVRSPGGIGGLLRPLSMSFTVRATPLSAGQLMWGANAYAAHSCGGAGSLIGVPPIVVVTGPAVTPTPAPTPPPTPAPTPPPQTPAPTPPSPTPPPILPLPSLPLPLPLPSLGPSGTPGPTSAPDDASPTPSATSGAAGPRSPTPSGDDPASGSPGRSASPDPVAPGADGGGGNLPRGALVGGRPLEPELAFDSHDLDLGFGAVGLIGGIEIWAVPAATIGVPGLLVLLWAALQAMGALAWVPAARRLRGDDRPGWARRT